MTNDTADIVVVSGGFDPVHSGHIQMFEQAYGYGLVIVCLNSDAWLTRKKGKPFMPWDERAAVIRAMRSVLQVIPMDDSDGTAVDGIKKVVEMFPGRNIIFANGGDRKSGNTPETDFCNENNVKLVWNIGGGKTQSSSWILNNWNEQ